MPIYTDQHDAFLNRIKNIINGSNHHISVEVNIKYDPLYRNKYDPDNIIWKSTKPKYFEYDIICFPNSEGIDYDHPIAFIEFTAQKYFSSKKFLYETYRWLWFNWNMGLLVGRHPFPESPLDFLKLQYQYRDVDRDVNKNYYNELDKLKKLKHLQKDYNPEVDRDINSKPFSPKFFQIWKTTTAKRHYERYKRLGLIVIDIDVPDSEDIINIYGIDIPLEPIFNLIYH